jgi:hypothetical protein
MIAMEQEIQKQKIGISGTRTKNLPNNESWDDFIFVALLRIVTNYDPAKVIFISGGADSGADKIIESVCKLLGYECDTTTFKPDFSKGYAVWKFFERNKQLAEAVEESYCIWNGESKGTKHYIEYTQQLMEKDSTKLLHIISFETMEHQNISRIEINTAWLMPPRPLFEVYVVQVYYFRDHPFRIQKDSNPNYYVLEGKQDLRTFFKELLQKKYNVS